MTDPQALPALRLTPHQERARATVDCLCDAAAQLLETVGPRGFTTNHVAARAGYSIGTLYRYFPDKQALLEMLARREVTRQQARVEAVLAAAPPGLGADGLARIVVRAALHPFDGRDRLRRAVLSLLPAAWLRQAARAAQPRVLCLLVAAVRHHAGQTLSETGRLTLMHVPLGAMVAAAREPALFAAPGFEDAMVRLVADCFISAPA